MTARPKPFVVHVAGEPQNDHLQRCVPCGTVLTDNRGWWSEHGVAVWGDDDRGPSWWPAGALVATDKEPHSHQASMTYVIDPAHGLDDDEVPCTGPRTEAPHARAARPVEDRHQP